MAILGTGKRLPLPGDCAACQYPKFMHEEGEPQQYCTFVPPWDTMRKQRLLLIRAVRNEEQHGVSYPVN